MYNSVLERFKKRGGGGVCGFGPDHLSHSAETRE